MIALAIVTLACAKDPDSGMVVDQFKVGDVPWTVATIDLGVVDLDL